MIGFLRFIGILNAAVWLGAASFHTFIAVPALNSEAARNLFGPKYFPYYSSATAQVLTTWYFYLGITCAFIAVGHQLIENLYLGRRLSRFGLGLLLALFALNLLGNSWVNPNMMALHRAQHALNTTVPAREAAARSFRIWQGVFQAMNLFLLVGATTHLWRASHPSAPPRFVNPTQFRG